MAVPDPATAPAGHIVADRDCGVGDGIGIWGARGGTRSVISYCLHLTCTVPGHSRCPDFLLSTSHMHMHQDTSNAKILMP